MASAFTALIFLLAGFPGYAATDLFAFLPDKDARRAREALAALDASLASRNDLLRRYSETSEKLRFSLAGKAESSAFKALVEAGAAETWRAGAGPSLAQAKAGVRKSADRLSEILKPYIDKAPEAALDGLAAELRERTSRIPGCTKECLRIAERAGSLDAPSRRFALRALLGVEPGEVARRLLPDGRDAVSLPYGKDANLAAAAEKMRTLRRAGDAVRAAAAALAVPELAWTPEESRRAEEAAGLLALLEPEARSRALRAAGIPGIDLLTGFLSGLSPEERHRWRMEHGLSSRSVRIFLSCAGAVPAAAPEADTKARFSQARSIAELERALARGRGGLDLLADMGDPALRAALRRDSAPEALKAAYEEALGRLVSALEAGLARAAAGPGSPGEPVSTFTVEIEFEQGPGGFSVLQADSKTAAGEEAPVSPEVLERALESVLPGPAASPSEPPKALRIGLLVRGGSTDGIDRVAGSGRFSDPEPAVFAALTARGAAELRAAAREDGLPVGCSILPEWAGLEEVCLRRCRGEAEDQEVAEVIRDSGGALAAAAREASLRRIEAVRRSLAVYAGEEPGP